MRLTDKSGVKTNTYLDIHAAYLGSLSDTVVNYDYESSPRGQKCFELLNYSFTIIHPKAEPIITKDLERNKVIADYTAKEMALYDSRSNDVEDFAKASSFWRKIANPDGTINSAYGRLIWTDNIAPAYYQGPDHYTAWAWAKNCLLKDKDSRQAFLRFSRPEHQWLANKDQVCTMHGNFLIREDKLHLTVVMRSNDIWLGLSYDLPWFISLMDRMLVELKPSYPNLEKGTYTHLAHSFHLYERNLEQAKRALGVIL